MKRNMPKFLRAHRQADSGHADSESAAPSPKKTNPECHHHQSQMKKAEPLTFLRYPYRPSVMTLLRQVQTKPADIVGCVVPKEQHTVYASYQQHWDHSVDYPVLTLVAACDTRIHSFLFDRTTRNEISITCAVTNMTSQRRLTFDIPLPSICSTIRSTNMDIVRAYETDDAFEKFSIHMGDHQTPLLIVNVHNLGTTSCNRLHVLSIITPEDPETNHEKYILALSGVRKRRFRTVYIHRSQPPMNMLDSYDLISMGYFTDGTNHHHTEKITVPVLEFRIDELLNVPQSTFPRLWPSNNDWGYSKDPEFQAPQRYPPPIELIVKPTPNKRHPQLFPPGYFRNRAAAYPSKFTVRDALEDYRKRHCGTGKYTPQELAQPFAYYHFAASATQVLDNLETLWTKFLYFSCGIQKQDTHVRISPLYQRGYTHFTWLPLEEHPTWQIRKRQPTTLSQDSESRPPSPTANQQSDREEEDDQTKPKSQVCQIPKTTEQINEYLQHLTCGTNCQCTEDYQQYQLFRMQYEAEKKN